MTLKGSREGIGPGVAEAVLAEGAQVVIVGRSEERLKAAAKRLGESPELKTVATEMTVEDDVERMFDHVDPIDHLVATRGIPPVAGPVETLRLDAVREFVDVMLISSIDFAKHAKAKIGKHWSITFTSETQRTNRDPAAPLSRRWLALSATWHALSHSNLRRFGSTLCPGLGTDAYVG
jgi:NAD(P)-dependent dehydrogenase (short-subunit alcohol dehydrogenase family)